MRNPWSLTQELRRVRPANRPPLSQKSGWEKRGETSGGKQREAVSNKDAGEQSAVSQIWGGKRDEEEDASPQTADIKVKYKNLRQNFFFSSLGLQKGRQNLVKIAFAPPGVQLWVTCLVCWRKTSETTTAQEGWRFESSQLIVPSAFEIRGEIKQPFKGERRISNLEEHPACVNFVSAVHFFFFFFSLQSRIIKRFLQRGRH